MVNKPEQNVLVFKNIPNEIKSINYLLGIRKVEIFL